MLTEQEISKRWLGLLTEHGVKLGPSNKGGQRYTIGFASESLDDVEVADHLNHMFEAVRATATHGHFELNQMNAVGLQFNDDNELGRVGMAIVYGPTARPAANM